MHFRRRQRSFSTPDHDDSNNDAVVTENPHDDLYAILHLPRDADVALIQRHFKLLSRVYHPDKIILAAKTQQRQQKQQSNGRNGSEGAEQEVAQEAFVAIKMAADVLSDPVYRLAYRYGGLLAVTLVKRSQQAAASASTTTRNASSHQQDDDDNYENEEDADAAPAEDLYTALQQVATNEMEAMQLVRQVVEEYELHQQQHGQPMPHWDATGSLPTVLLLPDNNNNMAWQRDGAASSLAVHSRYYPLASSTNAKHRSSTVATTISATATTETTGQTAVTLGTGMEGPLVRGTHVVADATWNLQNQALLPNLQFRTNRQTATGTVLVAVLGGPAQKLSQWNMSFLSYRNLQWPFGRHDDPTATAPNSNLQALWRLAVNVRGQLRHLSLTLRTLDETVPLWRCRLALAAYPVKVSWKGPLQQQDDDNSQSSNSSSSSCFYAAYSWAPQFGRAKILRIHRYEVMGSHHHHHHSHSNHWTVKYGLKWDGRAWLTGSPLWTLLCTLESPSLTLRLPIGLIQTTTSTAAAMSSTSPIVWMASLLWAEWVDQHVLAHVSSILFPDQQRNEVGFWSDELSGMTTPLHRDNGTTLQYYRNVIRHVASKKVQQEQEQQEESGAISSSGLVIVSALLQMPTQNQPQNWSSNHSTSIKAAVTELLQFCVVDDQLHLTWDDPRWNWWLVLPRRPASSSSHTIRRSENQPSPNDTSNIGGCGVVALFSYGRAWIHQWRTRLGLRFSSSHPADQEPIDPTSTAFHNCIPPSSQLYIRYQYERTLYEINLVAPSEDNSNPNLPVDDNDEYDWNDGIHVPHVQATALGPCDRVR